MFLISVCLLIVNTLYIIGKQTKEDIMFSKMITDWKVRRGLSRKYNETRRELNALTSRDLSDMGIHRSQIDQIALEAVYGR
jgi:uncharacterized protein YjiS (DUF1127 family)